MGQSETSRTSTAGGGGDDAGGVGGDLVEHLQERARPFLALVGSVASVTAVLLYAGFLSDFGAYQWMGLPRLSFSLTSLAEVGAEVTLDMLSLVADGFRIVVLPALLITLIALWLGHRSPRLQRWAQSHRLRHVLWMLALALAMMLFAAMADYAHRSLDGYPFSLSAQQAGLRSAYADAKRFPTPDERLLAIEREGYWLNFWPDWLPRVDTVWRGGPSTRTGESKLLGLPLRTLPMARQEARDVFGWLGLGLLMLGVGQVLLAWWGAYHRPQDLKAGADFADEQPIDAVIRRLVRPVTLVLTLLCLALLPLLHGFLARQAVGAETVMAYLKTEAVAGQEDAPQGSGKAGPGEREQPQAASDRLQCRLGKDADREEVAVNWQAALRKLVRTRVDDEDAQYPAALEVLIKELLAARCAEAVVQLWAVRPPATLMLDYPRLAQAYRQALLRLSDAYQVRIGTILHYPREGQPLTLIQPIAPRDGPRMGLWSIAALDPNEIVESVVLPDISLREAQAQASTLRRNSDDHTALTRLLKSTGSRALELSLPLAQEGRLSANASGVAISSLGLMAYAALAERPDLSSEAIKQLLRSVQPPPGTALNVEFRGAALSALGNSRSPYAAASIADLVGDDPQPGSCTGSDDPRAYCSGPMTTAVGHLLGAISEETARVGGSPPEALEQVRRRLTTLIVRWIVQPGVRDDFRGAACSALDDTGSPLQLSATEAQQVLATLAPGELAKYSFSAGACLANSYRAGADAQALRQILRRVGRGEGLENMAPREKLRHRSAAFQSLRWMGADAEDALVFSYYENLPGADEDWAKAVRSAMDEVNTEAMVKRLLECAADPERSQPARQHCIEGLAHVGDDFDGDDGSAATLWKSFGNDDGTLGQTTCRIMTLFDKRDGRWVGRHKHDDPRLAHCIELEAPAAELRARLERLDPELGRKIQEKLGGLPARERQEMIARLLQRFKEDE